MNNVWAHSPCCFLSDPLKRDFLGIDLTMFLGVCNFGNTSSMRVIFCWKYSKFKLDFKTEEKNWGRAFCFRDNNIWIRCVKLSLSRREYLRSALSVLGNSFEVLDRPLTETFCKTNAFPVINKYGKGVVLQIWTMFGCV